MIVAAAFGTWLITSAILSAVRSCRIRPSTGAYPRRGSTTVTWVLFCAAARLTSSRDARVSRRSGASIISSGMSCPNLIHFSCSCCARALSMTKWTARSVVGRRPRAYLMAASVARSTSSTKISTTRRL